MPATSPAKLSLSRTTASASLSKVKDKKALIGCIEAVSYSKSNQAAVSLPQIKSKASTGIHSWSEFLQSESRQPYWLNLEHFIQEERRKGSVYPPDDLQFQALKATALEKVKVVIIGQDPYHGPDQAMGLSFSVPSDQPLPPSLRNIYKEIERDLQIKMGKVGDLTPWANQGVLLLNALLTVRENEPLSHQAKGWETFTDHLLQLLAQQKQPIAFLLWGQAAQKKVEALLSQQEEKQFLLLKAPHPSPLSAHRGFLGCNHFSLVNEWLRKQKLEPIDWQL